MLGEATVSREARLLTVPPGEDGAEFSAAPANMLLTLPLVLLNFFFYLFATGIANAIFSCE